jgi:hypothetical protein
MMKVRSNRTFRHGGPIFSLIDDRPGPNEATVRALEVLRGQSFPSEMPLAPMKTCPFARDSKVVRRKPGRLTTDME